MNTKQIWDIIDQQQEDLIRFCCDMIKIPSENPPGDVEAVTKFICDFLDSYHILIGPTFWPPLAKKAGSA